LKKVLVYSHYAHSRLDYAAGFVFGTVGQCEWQITQSEEEFVKAEGVIKVVYLSEEVARAREDLPGFKTFQVSGWTTENLKPETALINNHFVLFPSPDQKTFDVFAMTYWCLSRQEEYLLPENQKDKHGRFPAKASLFHQHGVLEKPVLDIAVLYYLKQLGIEPEIPFYTQPSIDVDIAFALKGRSFLRTCGTFVKSALRNPFQIIDNLSVLLGRKQDPNDTYSYISEILINYSTTRIFWHCGKERNALDKQVLRTYAPFPKAIKQLSACLETGIHPSFVAYGHSNALKEEKNWLQSTCSKAIVHSRQHYILLKFPETYRNLIASGIQHDYSMGYPDAPGFRAGTARPFHWYDSEREEETTLTIHPFCIMEVTCSLYLNYNIENAVKKGLELKEIIKSTGGVFGFIFHNESLSNHGKWRGWRSVFETWLK
jgi:hypothetical protein